MVGPDGPQVIRPRTACHMNFDVRGQTAWNPGSAAGCGWPFTLQVKSKILGPLRLEVTSNTRSGGGDRHVVVRGMHSRPSSVDMGDCFTSTRPLSPQVTLKVHSENRR